MTVDPADDCTFWYTTEYMPTNGTFNWSTRIGSFKFPGCGGVTAGNDFSISASPPRLRGRGRLDQLQHRHRHHLRQRPDGVADGDRSAGRCDGYPVADLGDLGRQLDLEHRHRHHHRRRHLYVTVTGSAASGSHSTTVSLTVTAAGGGGCTATTQLFANPGFESGATGWTASPAVIDASTSGSAPRTGTVKAWLDGYGTTHTDDLSQNVTIPSTACSATLTFWLKITTAETTTTTAFDKLTVTVRNTAGTVLSTLATFSNLNKGTTYVQRTFDVTSFKGQTIKSSSTAPRTPRCRPASSSTTRR